MPDPRLRRRHADIDNHHTGVDGRVMRNVRRVPEQQLERVAAPRQGHGGFGLARAEMQVVLIVRDRLIQRRQRRIDEKMVMSRVRLVHPGRSNAHLFKPEADNKSGGHVGAALGRNNINARARRRRMAGSWRRGLRNLSRRRRLFHHRHVKSCRNRPAECGGCDPRRQAGVAACAVRAIARVPFPSGRRRSGDGSRRSESAGREGADPCRSADDDDRS